MYIKDTHTVWLATGTEPVFLVPSMANRHGLIAGATGTGKTVTLKVLAESFSDMGVPVFLADIKGDLSGMCQKGEETKHIRRSIDNMSIENFEYTSYPVRFFDVYGKLGHPVRTTISEMGPELLSRLLGLNDTQSGIMRIVFRLADDRGLLLLDLKDLRSMVQYVGDNAKELKMTYGNIAPQSIGAIQRALLALEDEGGNIFFGEPSLELSDWMAKDPDGRGIMNILECRELFRPPLLYSTFLLWMLSELYEMLPEAGDLEKPKLAFFFDEAHLLFKDAPKALVEKVEQVVRLIRSKGVSVWFITQNPSDLPDNVLGQIGNRVQHALRAYTPNDQKALRAAANSFRKNPEFDTEETLQALGVGEALISVLDGDGVPSVVQRANILPPKSSMSAVEDSVITSAVAESSLNLKYGTAQDRHSAFEELNHIREKEEQEDKEAQAREELNRERLELEREKREFEERRKKVASSRSKSSSSRSRSTYSRSRKSPLEKAIDTTATTIGREIGKKIVRGLFDTFLK